MSIRLRLLLSYILFVLLLLGVAGVAMYFGARNARDLEDVERDVVPDTLAAIELQTAVTEIHAWIGDALVSGSAVSASESMQKARDALDQALEVLNVQMGDTTGHTHEVEAHVGVGDMERLFREYFDLGASLLSSENAGSQIGAFRATAIELRQMLTEMTGQHLEILDGHFLSMRKAFSLTTLGALIIAGIAILSGVVFAVLITSRMTGPVSKIVEATERLSNGNLSLDVDHTGVDEFGTLALNFNSAIGGLRRLLGNVQDASGRNSEIGGKQAQAVSETSAALEQISSSITSMKRQIDALAASMETSAESVGSISGNIRSLDGRIEEQSSTVEESTAAIEEMIASIQNVATITKKRDDTISLLNEVTTDGGSKLDATYAVVSEISSLTHDMTNIIGIIKSIAGRTNLLSINAAIEAAHAGDSGRGFAVVANEIRALAESTADNSQSIAKSLESITEKIHSALTSSEDSRSAFGRIDAEVREFTQALAEIATTMSEMSNGSQEVLAGITGLSTTTTEIRNQSGDINENSGRIASELSKARDVTGEVRTGITEIEEAVQDASQRMTEALQLSHDSVQSIQQLDEEVGRFVV